MEIWKNINQFKSNRKTIKLEISNFGNIKKTFKRGLITITTGYNTNGYKCIEFNKKNYYVHRLVLEHFVGECPENFECDHIDRNRSNNHIENLKWCNRSENLKNRNPYKCKSKKGSIRKTKSGSYKFQYYINKQKKTKTFKTEIEAKLAQAFYKGAINIIEKY
tara:strand:+ start:345 stop:833 length:489 start_codon:yes stop_codon:yes gene_type:complete